MNIFHATAGAGSSGGLSAVVTGHTRATAAALLPPLPPPSPQQQQQPGHEAPAASLARPNAPSARTPKAQRTDAFDFQGDGSHMGPVPKRLRMESGAAVLARPGGQQEQAEIPAAVRMFLAVQVCPGTSVHEQCAASVVAVLGTDLYNYFSPTCPVRASFNTAPAGVQPAAPSGPVWTMCRRAAGSASSAAPAPVAASAAAAAATTAAITTTAAAAAATRGAASQACCACACSCAP